MDFIKEFLILTKSSTKKMMVSEVLTFFLGFYVWRHFEIDEIRYTEIDGAIEVATEFQDGLSLLDI